MTMSHAPHILLRPRNVLYLFLFIPLLSLLYMSRSYFTSSRAVGYVPPHVVLPSYVSAANVPQCLPARVEDHGMSSGWMSMWGGANGAYEDDVVNSFPEDEELEEGERSSGWAAASRTKTGSLKGSTKPAVQAPLIPTDAVPVEGITNYMKAHIAAKQVGFDPAEDHEYLGLNIGASWDLDEYADELAEVYETYLAVKHIPNPSFLPPVLSRLSLRPPIAPLPPRPRQIITTDKSRDDLPTEFARWKEIMPDWSIRYFDDAGLADWVETMFGGTRAQFVWSGLPRAVLKADVFRYMIMLVEGGIYTDSDTAPIVHADGWGMPYQNGTDKLLVDLSRVLSLAGSPYLSPAHQASSTDEVDMPTMQGEDSGEDMFDAVKASVSSASAETTNDSDLFRRRKATPSAGTGTGIPKLGPGSPPLVNDGSELGVPSLVISVESDAIEFGWNDWREVGLSRAVQIVQWTFMARPGHPIFLDAIGRTLKKTEEIATMEREAREKGEIFVVDSALEWTGPAVFTDCVYRYLLTRYGFKPRDLLHQKQPIRIGDVLILPAGSYSSVSPFGDEGQRDWAASWHGFFGRWRNDDPTITEFERLKKIKEDEEERVRLEVEIQQAEGRVEPGEQRSEDR